MSRNDGTLIHDVLDIALVFFLHQSLTITQGSELFSETLYCWFVYSSSLFFPPAKQGILNRRDNAGFLLLAVSFSCDQFIVHAVTVGVKQAFIWGETFGVCIIEELVGRFGSQFHGFDRRQF